MPDPSSAGLKELLNHRFAALLVVSFLASFVSAPLYSSLLPAYVEAGLSRSPLFTAGLRGLFFMLGGLCSVPAGMLCDAFGIKRVLILGQFGPLLAGAIFFTGDPLSFVGALDRPWNDVRIQQHGRAELPARRRSSGRHGHGPRRDIF